MIHQANKCINVFGARSKKSFVFLFSKRKKQRDFVRFLKVLKMRWGKVLLFIDGAPGHKGALVKAFLRANRKTFRLVRFPSYTPELNPVEQCWMPGRRKLANRLVKTLPTMKYHLCNVFNNPKNMPKMFHYLSD